MIRSSYDDKAKEQRMQYLVWVEVRRLQTHPLLLVLVFNIKVRDNIVVSESAIDYLETLDSPATDLKTAYEVLSRGCKVRDRLQLKAIVSLIRHFMLRRWKSTGRTKGYLMD